MKKKCKAYTQTKFFNESITTPDITQDITTSSITTDIPSKGDIILTHSRSDTDINNTSIDNNDINNNDLKQLVEDIVEYTRTWTIGETEWYWNVECVRKPSNINDKEITWEEFETAIREEILYDLIYNNGSCLYNQMENDLENYGTDCVAFQDASKELEKKIQRIFKDFKIERK